MKTHILISALRCAVLLSICPLSGSFAQDMFHLANGSQYPIYLSRKVVLVQYHDQRLFETVSPSKLAERAQEIRLLRGMGNLAYVIFPDGLSRSDLDESVSEIRKNANILSAHPMMTTPDGVEFAGFLDEIIVKLKAHSNFEAVQTAMREIGLNVKAIDEFDQTTFYLSGPAVLTDPIRVCNELFLTGLIDFAQPNNLRHIKPAGVPSDPLFSSQWGHTKMQVPEAWDISTGCSAINIAIIDNGVQLNHPDLVNNIIGGYDALGNGTKGAAVAGETPHGTKCAGIAAASANNVGIAGVAYSCKIVPVRAYSTSGNDISTDVFIATAINYAASVADVVSMSWTIVSTSHPSIDLAITAAINNATTAGRGNKGCILIGAVGNDGMAVSTLPTRLPNVLAVGTSVQNDTKWAGTNTPSGTYKLDVAAPGPDVTTLTGSSYSNSPNDHRTSWSAPAVAGIAALILSSNPALTHTQVRRLIVETCEKVGGYSYIVGNSSKFVDLSHHNDMGHGRANAFKALEKAAGGPITGPSMVCTTANFSLTSPIAGATVVWSTTNPGLAITNAGAATRQSGFNGEVTVVATVTAPGSCAVTLRKKIYVGAPALMNGYYTSNGLQYGLVESDISYPNTICWTGSPTTGNIVTSIPGSTSTAWTKISSTPSGLIWSSTGGNLTITFQSIGQQGIFKLSYSNICGALSKFYGIKSVSCAAFIAYPNPASDQVLFEFENPDDPESLPSEIQLISEQSQQVVLTIDVGDVFNQKQFMDGNKLEMNVSGLKRGTYYICAVPGKNSKHKSEKIRLLLE